MNRKLFLWAAFAALHAQGQTYTIVTGQPQQTIEHFGASDAWSMQTIDHTMGQILQHDIKVSGSNSR